MALECLNPRAGIAQSVFAMLNDYLIDAEETITRTDGEIIHFGRKRFQRDIVEGDCCFMCGVARDTVPFNDEHVLPDWLLREFGLHDQSLTLPNAATRPYSRLRIPCCVSCNSRLGRTVEQPISALLKGTYEEVAGRIQQTGVAPLFDWLTLLFLKTHLKDKSLRYYLDARKGTETIADQYDWGTVHHLHCVARSLLTGTPIDPRVRGSVFVFKAKQRGEFREFDFADLYKTKIIYIQLREVAIFGVLDDAGMVQGMMEGGPLSKIAGPLSTIQLREVLARIAYCKSVIMTNPVFLTDLSTGTPRITLEWPVKLEVEPAEKQDPRRLGAMMEHICAELMGNNDGPDKPAIMESLRNGQRTFVFGPDGKFEADSMEPPVA